MHAARHRRPVARPRRRLLVLLASLALAAGVAPPPFSTAPAAAAAADPCGGDYSPAVTRTTVNQGLGTYTPLVRGKTTLVRLFLVAPDCAPTGSVQLVGTRVRATEGGRVIAEVADAAGPAYPVLPSAATGAGNDGAWNPVLKLPALGRGTATSQTDVVLSAQLTVRVTLPGGLPRDVSLPYRDVATAPLAAPSNGLRVLVVPLGDASRGVDPQTQFPRGPSPAPGALRGEYADTVLQKAMQTASRVLPVPDGVGSLASTAPAGLKYTLSSGMVDLRSFPVPVAGSRFCLDGIGFTSQNADKASVASTLNATLATWNGTPGNPPADRVLGVLWQGVSGGTTGLPGLPRNCAEGLGEVKGRAAYLRLLAGSTVNGVTGPTPNPTSSGALAVMELMHTLGGAPVDARGNKDFHSKSVGADPEPVPSGYDTTRASWIPAPYSAMRYSGETSGYEDPATGEASPWNDSNVLLEREDFGYGHCVLSPTLAVESCPAAARGTAGVVAAASAALVLSGTSDGTVEGTSLRSTYDATVEPSRPDGGSDYRLVVRDAAGLVVPLCGAGESGCSPQGDLGIPTNVVGADHDSPGDVTVDPDLTRLSLYAVVPVDERARSLEVWKGRPGARCTPTSMPAGCLYARAASSEPVVTTATTGVTFDRPQDLTPAPGDDTAPALAADGTAFAWVTAQGLRVQSRDVTTGTATGTPSRAVPGLEPSWSPDGTRLAYSTTAGDIEVVDVDRSGSTPVLGSPVRVYDHLLQTPPLLGSTEASSPSWSPDGTALAVAIDDGVWRLTVEGAVSTRITCDLAGLTGNPTCRPLVTGSDASSPDWGGTAENGLVAYVEGGRDVHTVDPDAPGVSRRLRVPGATDPSWGGGLLAYASLGRVGVADPTRTDPVTGEYLGRTPLGETGDALPALARDARVLALQRRSGANGLDVVVGTLGSTGGDVTFDARTEGDPALLRGSVHLSCSSEQDPVVVELLPVRTSGSGPGTATFSTDVDARRACPGGTLSAGVHNGWDVAPLTAVRTYPTVSRAPAPSPTVSAPVDGSTYLAYEPVYGVSSSVDAGAGTNGAGTTTTWTLTGPDGVTRTLPQTGTEVRLDPPLPGGRQPGTWTLTASVTGPAGSTGRSSSTFTVLPDPEHRGANATVTFDPQTLFVPSSGNAVTLRVAPQAQRLSRVAPSSVRVTSVGGRPVDLPVLSFTVDARGVGQAKVDRQVLTEAMARTGRGGGYLPVVLRGGSGSDAFVGSDTRYPVATPS